MSPTIGKLAKASEVGIDTLRYIDVPNAAGVLYPVIGVLLSPMIAAAAMSLSLVSAIAHALRLRAQRL